MTAMRADARRVEGLVSQLQDRVAELEAFAEGRRQGDVGAAVDVTAVHIAPASDGAADAATAAAVQDLSASMGECQGAIRMLSHEQLALVDQLDTLQTQLARLETQHRSNASSTSKHPTRGAPAAAAAPAPTTSPLPQDALEALLRAAAAAATTIATPPPTPALTLAEAVRNGNIAAVRAALPGEVCIRNNANISMQGVLDDTACPLRLAVRLDRVECMQALLEGWAARLPSLEHTLLLWLASASNALRCAEALATHIGDVGNVPLTTNPLYTATSAQMVELLISHGASPNVWDPTMGSPLCRAVAYFLRPVAEALLVGGATPDALMPDGDPVLNMACNQQWPDMVRLLIDAGADPARRAAFPQGTGMNPPMMYAPPKNALDACLAQMREKQVSESALACVRELIRPDEPEEARFNMENEPNALHVACGTGCVPLVALLLEGRGARSLLARSPCPPCGAEVRGVVEGKRAEWGLGEVEMWGMPGQAPMMHHHHHHHHHRNYNHFLPHQQQHQQQPGGSRAGPPPFQGRPARAPRRNNNPPAHLGDALGSLRRSSSE